jgi:hypothetical protein
MENAGNGHNGKEKQPANVVATKFGEKIDMKTNLPKKEKKKGQSHHRK